MSRITDTADLMTALAVALEEKDLEALERIQAEISGWIIPNRERVAQALLIEAIGKAIEDAI